jgi:hypothetical protein
MTRLHSEAVKPIALARDHSQTLRRLFIALSWAILLVGAVVYLSGRSSSASHASPGPAATTSESDASLGKTIPLPPAALNTAKSFITNAVLRKNLAVAWDESAPALRGGLTRDQWMTGQIPVAQYPANAFAKAAYKVVHSREKEVMLLVFIFPAKGSGVPGWDYYAKLVPRDGRWLVSYFQTRGHAGPVPKGPA